MGETTNDFVDELLNCENLLLLIVIWAKVPKLITYGEEVKEKQATLPD